MSTTLKIPMNEETRISLEDAFIDNPNMDARKFVFEAIKQACQDGKRSIRNLVTPVNRRQDNGQMKQEEHSLKGIKLEKYTLPSNPEWLPKNIDKESNAPLELKLGENTMKYLSIYGQIVLIRHEQYNMAEDAFLDKTIKEMKESGAPIANIENYQKQQELVRKDRLAAIPNCLEEAVYVSIWPILQQKIDQSDSQMFEKEFNEVNKDQEQPSGQ